MLERELELQGDDAIQSFLAVFMEKPSKLLNFTELWFLYL